MIIVAVHGRPATKLRTFGSNTVDHGHSQSTRSSRTPKKDPDDVLRCRQTAGRGRVPVMPNVAAVSWGWGTITAVEPRHPPPFPLTRRQFVAPRIVVLSRVVGVVCAILLAVKDAVCTHESIPRGSRPILSVTTLCLNQTFHDIVANRILLSEGTITGKN